MNTKHLYEIDGYGVVLPKVQNYYPVEEIDVGWQWGFKYDSGVFESFQYKAEKIACSERWKFIKALEKSYQ